MPLMAVIDQNLIILNWLFSVWFKVTSTRIIEPIIWLEKIFEFTFTKTEWRRIYIWHSENNQKPPLVALNCNYGSMILREITIDSLSFWNHIEFTITYANLWPVLRIHYLLSEFNMICLYILWIKYQFKYQFN